jgi:UDP-glucose 4-epimerase
VRDYVHVTDLAAAHVLALQAPNGGRMTAYNVGCGRSYSVREVIHAVEEVTGCRIPVRLCPRRPGDPAVLCASPAKLHRELGWKPVNSDLGLIVESAWRWKLGAKQSYGAA